MRVRLWRHAAAGGLMVVASGALCQGLDENWMGGFLLAESSHAALRGTPVNPANLLGIASVERTGSVVVEGEWKRVTFRAKGEAHGNSADPGTSSRFILQELNRVFRLTENQTLSVGKRLFALDQTFAGQPLGFFQKQTDLSDPTDASSRAEGLPMLVYTWAEAAWSFNAMYGDDSGSSPDGFNRGIRQWVLRVSAELPRTSVSLLTRRASGESVGIGGSFSATLSDDKNAYGSFYTARGTTWPTVRGLVDGSTATLATSPAEAVGPFRANDGRMYPRAAIGLTYTPRDRPRMQVEVMYDRRGLSDSQFRRYVELVESHALAHAIPGLAPLAAANLAFDAEALVRRGARRKYVNLTVEHGIGPLAISAGVHAGIADGSAVWYATLSRALGRHTTLSFSTSLLTGSATSERGLSPVRYTATARLKISF